MLSSYINCQHKLILIVITNPVLCLTQLCIGKGFGVRSVDNSNIENCFHSWFIKAREYFSSICGLHLACNEKSVEKGIYIKHRNVQKQTGKPSISKNCSMSHQLWYNHVLFIKTALLEELQLR